MNYHPFYVIFLLIGLGSLTEMSQSGKTTEKDIYKYMKLIETHARELCENFGEKCDLADALSTNHNRNLKPNEDELLASKALVAKFDSKSASGNEMGLLQKWGIIKTINWKSTLLWIITLILSGLTSYPHWNLPKYIRLLTYAGTVVSTFSMQFYK